MEKFRDIIIIGAGPAGLSAAVTASAHGLDVIVLDDQPSVGGQIYRNIENAGKEKIKLLGPDYGRGTSLVEQFKKSRAHYLGNAIVWQINAQGNVCFSKNGKSTEINGRHILLATGAMERPVPFSGWTLPGVMGAGAVDANFKSSSTIPQGPVVLAGSGPLLLLTAAHLATLNVKINAVLDTTPLGNYRTALPFLPRALTRPDYLLKGLGMLLNLQKPGGNYVRGVTEYKAHGSDTLDHVSFKTRHKTHHVDAGVLLVHEGIVPRCDFTRQLDIKHLWDPVQRYWYPETNALGNTALKTVHVAGDGAFVHGGVSAQLKGTLAAIDMAGTLGALPGNNRSKALENFQNDQGVKQSSKSGALIRNQHVNRLKKQLNGELAPRPFVDALYRPRPHLYNMDDDTLICRCESVTAKDIRQAISQGCREPNEIKTLTRCGMGPCQGRMCGMALTEIIAESINSTPCDLKALSIRPPVRSISLSELAKTDLLEHHTQ